MRITSKGQVTIPQWIRERHGFHPGKDVRFVEHGNHVELVKGEGGDAWEKYRGALKYKQSTDKILRKLRGSRP